MERSEINAQSIDARRIKWVLAASAALQLPSPAFAAERRRPARATARIPIC